MREYVIAGLILLFTPAALSAQTVPAGWQVIKDAGNICQIAVPPDWTPLRDSGGAAVLHDTSTAVAIVTSQPQQEFKPLPEVVRNVLGITREKMFENTANRLFYQDKTSQAPLDTNGFTVSVPGKSGGTCSSHLTFLPTVTEDTARKIALSLAPVSVPARGTN